MKVLALTRYSHLGASSRVRFFQYGPCLGGLGIDVHIAPLLRDNYLVRLYAKQPIHWLELLGDYLRQVVRIFSAGKFDLLWIEKELFPNLPAWFEQGLNRMGIRYVVDYDDAIFHNYDLSRNPLKRLFAKKIDKVMQGAALVVCGNAYLAERARQAGARRIEIVPTVVDLERYAVGDQRQSGRIVIGWVGSPTTVKYLAVVAPALQKIAAEFPVQLRVIGAQFDLPGLDVDCRLWTEESEVREIQNFDIGIMPLLDSPWERGKCGYKLIQYLACGVPGIASPVGVNKEIIANGVNGYLATSSDDWLSAFRLLCADAQLRRAMGGRGRHIVEERYCLQVTGPLLAKLFQEVAAASPTIKGRP